MKQIVFTKCFGIKSLLKVLYINWNEKYQQFQHLVQWPKTKRNKIKENIAYGT